MKLYYYADGNGNVGDDLNPWLWPRILSTLLNEDESSIFLGIGTLINDRAPRKPRKIVFGSGLGYGYGPPVLDDTWTIYCVRGPLTANALDLPRHMAITDPAILLATLRLPKATRLLEPAFIPHHKSAELADWSQLCDETGLRYIDPRWSVDNVISEIQRSRFVISEAMHGAIIADTLRVPWVSTVCYPHISEFKWLDWCMSLSLPYTPIRLRGPWRPSRLHTRTARARAMVKRSLRRVGITSTSWTPPFFDSTSRERDTFLRDLSHAVSSATPQLSAESRFASRLDQLLAALETLKLDLAQPPQ